MDDKILDSPFENEFHFKLKDDEEILWENEKFLGWNFLIFLKYRLSITIIIFFLFGSSINFIINFFIFKVNSMLVYGLLFLLFVLLDYLFYDLKIKKKYILTSQRLIFQTYKNKKNRVLKISLADIKTIDVELTSLFRNKGNVLIDIDNLTSNNNHEFFFENVTNSLEQKKLVLLNVDDTPKILKLIRQARLNLLDL